MDILIIILVFAIFILPNLLDKKKPPVPKNRRNMPPVDIRLPRTPDTLPQPQLPQQPRRQPQPIATHTSGGPASHPERQMEGNRQPAPQKSRLGFEIPELRNAPTRESEPAGYEVDGVYRDAGTVLSDMAERYREEMADREHELAYELKRKQEEAQVRAAEQAAYVKQAQLPLSPEQAAIQEEKRQAALYLTPEAALNAVVWAEVLGQPKAHRIGYRKRH